MIQAPDEFMREYEKATRAHDLEATLALITDDAIYLFSDESVHVGKPAIRRLLMQNFELIENEQYTISNLTWLVKTSDAAACVYDYAWSGLVNGRPVAGSGRGTGILKRSGTSWQVTHEHLSKGKFAA